MFIFWRIPISSFIYLLEIYTIRNLNLQIKDIQNYLKNTMQAKWKQIFIWKSQLYIQQNSIHLKRTSLMVRWSISHNILFEVQKVCRSSLLLKLKLVLYNRSRTCNLIWIRNSNIRFLDLDNLDLMRFFTDIVNVELMLQKEETENFFKCINVYLIFAIL